MNNLEELRTLSPADLNQKLLDLRKEQFNLRLKRSNGELDKTHQFSQTRKLIAQIKTILTEKTNQV